jgi:hypothetical protein
LFTGHLNYLEVSKSKAFFALGSLELWKSLSFHVRLYHILESGKIRVRRIFLSSFVEVVFWGVGGLVNWLIEEMKEDFGYPFDDTTWVPRAFQVKEVWVSQSNIPSNSNGFIEMKGLGFWSNLRWESKILKCQGNYISMLWSFSNTLSCSICVCVCVCVCVHQRWSSMVLTMNILAWSWYWELKKFHTSLALEIGSFLKLSYEGSLGIGYFFKTFIPV